MTRQDAVGRAERYFDEGRFEELLAGLVAMPTESQAPGREAELRRYLDEALVPWLGRLGFATRILPNPVAGYGPFLLAERHEGGGLPTVLTYGHGDVVLGYEEGWTRGQGPWQLARDGERWYGRGAADNKGQHAINLAALEQVMEARGGRLGFNVKLIVEMGEETGSPGLAEICRQERDALAADLLIASDGPRFRPDRPTLFLGSRGVINFELSLALREGAHHSGNWGGLLANPGTILANAIASMVDGNGRILVEGLRPPAIPEPVRRAIADLGAVGAAAGPAVDSGWGEPGLSPGERVFGWNSLEVLAYETGNPARPANAIPAAARAVLQLRFVVGTDAQRILEHVRAHLAAQGYGMIEVAQRTELMTATRLDPDDPWVRWAVRSVEATTGTAPAILPNLGGSLPNEVFAEILGLPTVWVPHSYAGCSQHAPDEHLLAPVAREGLAIMAGLFWDLGEKGSAS
ncbi:M20 family metallopeptidase [Geminicoccaceae bacterium 1502E]|nr:M20 family metallopeptidase [Geminicoccaceae bacterium 1502E]